MTSRPLFIIVAELIVTFGPMFQVGCASASAGVMVAKVSSGRRRNGPPLAVSTSACDESRSSPREALPECAVLAVDGDDPGTCRGRTRPDQVARHHEDLLGGGRDRAARVDRSERRPDRRRARDGHADDVGIHRGDLARGVQAGAASVRERCLRARDWRARCAARRIGPQRRRARPHRSRQPLRPARNARGSGRSRHTPVCRSIRSRQAGRRAGGTWVGSLVRECLDSK